MHFLGKSTMAALREGRFQHVRLPWRPNVPQVGDWNKPHQQLQQTGTEQAGIVVRQCARVKGFNKEEGEG